MTVGMTGTNIRPEDTIASVRLENDALVAEKVEADRQKTKRALLESLLDADAVVDSVYETVKARKKALKELRAELKDAETADLSVEELRELAVKVGTVLGGHRGGVVSSSSHPFVVSAHVMNARDVQALVGRLR